MRPLPPRASGQPTACARSPSTSPNDAETGRPRPSIACAEMPANRARASGPRKASLARAVAGSSAGSPKRAIRIGWRGGRTTGRRSSGTSRSHSPRQRPEQPRPGGGVRAEGQPQGRAPIREIPLQDDRAGRRQGVRHGDIRVDPLDAVAREVHGPEERRRDPQRMGGRADVVDEPGQRQLGRPRPAADGVRRLVDAHRAPGPRELDRRGEAVGPAADDDRVERPRRGGSTGHGRTASGPAQPVARRRRAQRAGAVIVPTAMLRAALWRTLPAYRHWRRRSTHTRLRADQRRLDPEGPGEVLQRPLPEPVVGPVRAEHVRELDQRVARALQRLDLDDGVLVVAIRRERDPRRQRVALGRHERERLAVGVDDEDARGHLHRRARYRRHLEQRDLARGDPGQRRIERRALGPERREARLPVGDHRLRRDARRQARAP